MERDKTGTDESVIIEVENPPGGDSPHSIRFETSGDLRKHPSFTKLLLDQPLAVVRNEDGYVIGALRMGIDHFNAAHEGETNRRIAKIDVCDTLGIPQDIVDN